MAELTDLLVEVWERQAADGFLLTRPGEIETRAAADPETGVEFRFVWLPHRELRHNVAELERRGILDPDRDEALLFRDPRDDGRHCFLCPANIRVAHPREILIDLELGGRPFVAGVNFAWSAPHHFTVMTATHTDQRYSERTLGEMLELQTRTGSRVTWHGAGVGATIGWHFHYQITTQAFPVERLRDDRQYPTTLWSFTEVDAAHEVATAWIEQDPLNHDLNLLVTAGPTIFAFPRDRGRSHAANKGLTGVFEAAGYFVYSEPKMQEIFATADAATAREALAQIRPGIWPG